MTALVPSEVSPQKQIRKDQDILSHARNQLTQNNIPEFQTQYTLETIRKKIQEGHGEMAEKIVASSIKIYRALVKRIDSRENKITQLLQFFDLDPEIQKESEQKLRQMFQDLKDISGKLGKQFGHWLKVVGNESLKNFWFRSLQQKQSEDQKDYIPIYLSNQRVPIKLIKEKLAYPLQQKQINPLLLTEQQFEQNILQSEKETIKKLISLSQFKKDSESPHSHDLEHRDLQNSPIQKSPVNSFQREIQDKETDIFPDKQFKLSQLRKFKEMAGEIKRVNRYYSNPNSPSKRKISKKKRQEQMEEQTSKILSRVKQLKSKVDISSPKQDKKSFQQGLQIVEKFRTSRIRMIAEIQHENFRSGRKTEEQKLFQLTSSTLLHNLKQKSDEPSQLSERKKNHSKEPNQKRISPEQRRQSIDDFIRNSPQRKQLNKSKKNDIKEINASLSNLKSKIKSLNKIDNNNDANSNYESRYQQSLTNKNYLTAKSDFSGNNKNYLKKDQRIVMGSTVTKKKSLVDLKEANESIQNKINVFQKEKKAKLFGGKKNEIKEKSPIKASQSQPLERQKDQSTKKQNYETQKPITNEQKKLFIKKKQLEQIAQDIENQNFEKEEQINHQKMKAKNLQLSMNEKKHKIEELEKEVKKFKESGQTSNNEEEDIFRLLKEKKIRSEKFENEKKQILMQMKQIEQKMKKQEKKFVKLKQKQLKVDYDEKQKELNKQNEILLKDLEEKTQQLQKTISIEESKSKMYEKQLKEQTLRNEKIAEQLKKQNQLEELLLAQIKKITEERNSKKEKDKQKKIDELKEEIQEIESAHKKALLQFERQTQNIGSMFESMRLKNIQLEAKIKNKGQEITESQSQPHRASIQKK